MSGLLLVAFGTSFWILHVWQAHHAGRLLTGVRHGCRVLLDRVLQLTFQPLRDFVAEFSHRNDLLECLKNGDPTEAAHGTRLHLKFLRFHHA